MKITNSNSEYEKLLKIIDKDLLKFLKENYALELFVKNLKPDRLLLEIEIDNIGDEFLWFVSSEGHDFWSKLDKEYRKIKHFNE